MYKLSVDALGYRCVHGDEGPTYRIFLKLATRVDGVRLAGGLTDHWGA
jgi:hypothetical protein